VLDVLRVRQWLGIPAAVNLAALTVLASAALALRVPRPAEAIARPSAPRVLLPPQQ